ncbi:MAG: hypothetical protein IPH44_37005 [Myxococcales bacterium]|nr:hypothetical protein [Myxococcales bacterium]MBK7191006.1 hypothetical protein [Myxococcales bacterium]MBP6847093.1 hypothetical protein [Kofleriaceae bacterium]
MPPAYAVERCAPAAVRADLERLWDANLTLESHPADKFGWLYAEAPVVPATVFVLRADGAAVGTAGVGVRRFQLGADVGEAGLLADLAVDKAHRSVGPALALVRAGKAFVDEAFALAYGFPNKLAEGVFKRAGYQPLGTIGRYAMPLRHAAFATRLDEQALTRVPAAARPALVRAAHTPVVAAIAGRAVDAVQLGRAAPAMLAGLRRLTLAAIPQPTAELDELWAAARGDYAVVAERTRRFVGWRFLPRPERRVWTARARAGGGLRAYAVVDLIDGVAHVRDLFGHKDDVIALIDCLPLTLYAAGASSLSMRYLGAGWLTDALVARGLSPRASTRMIAVTAGAACPPAARALVTDATAWHLTDFDEDV